jgi:hypothetical protein
LNVLNPNHVEELAAVLGAKPGLVEKDWHVVRALGVLATLDFTDATPVFSGGTSLSKGWGFIKRFSEDIDFKVIPPAEASATANRNKRRAFRKRILSAITANQFKLVGDPLVGNESQFFAVDFAYPSHFATGQGLRPHLRVEMSFHAPALQPISRPLQSLMAKAQKQPPEISSFPCVDPIETAADKLSALGWRVCTRKRDTHGDDPAVIRHLYDLAVLESRIGSTPEFATLVRQIAKKDAGRGGGGAPVNAAERFALMLDLLSHDKDWAKEYDTFVLQVSFAGPDEMISFAEAFAATQRLAASIFAE